MDKGTQQASPLQLWGGVECTVNRVADRYFHQMLRSGHWQRACDLERFATLGIQKLRYPALWELTAPDSDLSKADWAWADQRLSRLRQLAIEPIVGLVHHGSGPQHTDLLNPGFAEGLSAYARAFARRFPWVEDYTPVNEPLTTARFSALYGVWYPHARDYGSLARALVNQCRATVMAMRQIRKVNSKARLVQTEDLGTVMSTEPLAYQAAFENQRRWLSLDLLCGHIDRLHPLYELLLQGVGEDELAFFVDNPCPPDVVGINYYVTSDRFLDHRLENYPPHLHGGNGRHAYADIEAVRTPAGLVGHAKALREAWQRYKLPIAITEVHLDCHREDQLRWFNEAWQAALKLRTEGADIHAVTMWSLLGAHDWNTLCTRDSGYYESGAYDLRSDPPRPTALTQAARAFSSRGSFEHPVLAGQGWWRREVRTMNEFLRAQHEDSLRAYALPVDAVVHGSVGDSGLQQLRGRSGLPCARPRGGKAFLHLVGPEEGTEGQPLLITGANGTLGQAFARACEARALRYVLLTRQHMDIAEPDEVARVLAAFDPWAVINTAGYVRVDDAETDRDRCFRENALGAQTLAQATAQRSLPLVTFSSDLVFSGHARTPYHEGAKTGPLNAYGESKWLAETLVREANARALVVRTSAFFGPWDVHNFVFNALRAWQVGDAIAAMDDVVVSPTYVPDLVRVTLDLLIDDERGIWHLTNEGANTWADALAKVASILGYPQSLVKRRSLRSFGLQAKRPHMSALTSRRGALMPSFDDALARFVSDAAVQRHGQSRLAEVKEG